MIIPLEEAVSYIAVRNYFLEHTIQKYSAENEEWNVDSYIVNACFL
jgi:hypothetical protein